MIYNRNSGLVANEMQIVDYE